MPSPPPDERAALLPPPAGRKSGDSAHHNLAGYSALHFRLTAASIWCCTFFAAFDNTVLATLTSTISSRFAAANQGAWLGTAYLLSSCCFTPIYGRLADVFGRRTAHTIAMFWFALGTALCTVAPSMRTLIAARFVAGIGGGGVQSMAVIILTDLVDLRHRGLFQGYANIVFGLGSGLGGPVGGWVSDTFGWRAAFGMQVPLLLVGGWLTWMCLTGDVGHVEAARAKAKAATANPSVQQTLTGRLRQIDYLGSATLVLAVGTLILGLSLKTSSLTSSGLEYSWTDPLILGLLISSLALTFLFLYIEARIAPAPVLPFSLLARRTPAAVAASLALVAANQFSLVYNVPLFFTAVKLDSASIAGAHLLPYSVLVGVGSLSVGYMIRRTGRYWWTCVGSGIIVLAGAVMLCFWNTDSPEWFTWVAQSPSGFGYAGVLTGTLVALMTDVTIAGKGEVAVGTSMSYLFRSIGQVLGVSLSAALIQSVLRTELSRRITGPGAQQVIDTIRRSTESIPALPAAQREAAVASYQTALRWVFGMNVALAVLGLVALCGIKEEVIPERKAVVQEETE